MPEWVSGKMQDICGMSCWSDVEKWLIKTRIELIWSLVVRVFAARIKTRTDLLNVLFANNLKQNFCELTCIPIHTDIGTNVYAFGCPNMNENGKVHLKMEQSGGLKHCKACCISVEKWFVKEHVAVHEDLQQRLRCLQSFKRKWLAVAYIAKP